MYDSESFTWLTGVSNDYMRRAAGCDLYGKLGVLLGPGTFGGPGSKIDYTSHIPDYSAWALDNGCFTNSGAFDESAWLDRLEWIYNEVPEAHERCLFAVAPDVFDPQTGRGNAFETILRSLPVMEKIRNIGVPAALVYQDGLEMFRPDNIPWSDFDVAFIGGSTEFKLGYPSNWQEGDSKIIHDKRNCKTEAFFNLIKWTQRAAKPIHVGRVNTEVRLMYSRRIGAASADGTLIARSGEKGLNSLVKWLAPSRDQMRMF
jgi:hypothetical protein